jgi:hypothetical protein
MTISFEFNLDKFAAALEKAPDIIGQAARTGMHDALDEWKADAVDIAPIDEGTLRRSITVGEIEGSGLSIEGSVSANATVKSKSGRFNYAYYIHEGFMRADGKKLRAPGTVEEFIDVPAKKNEAKWQSGIEREVQDGLDKAGW